MDNSVRDNSVRRQFGTDNSVRTIRYETIRYVDNSVRDNSVRTIRYETIRYETIRYVDNSVRDNSVRGQLGTRTIRYVVYCIALKFFRGGELGIFGYQKNIII